MSSPYRIVDASPEHIAQLLAKPLRRMEAHNWVTVTGRQIPMVLYTMRKQDAPPTFRMLLNDSSECLCLWAVGNGLGWGNLWLLASRQAESIDTDIGQHLAQDFTTMQEQYAGLLGFITHAHQDDRQLDQWLVTAGFIASGMFERDGEPFTTYSRKSPDIG